MELLEHIWTKLSEYIDFGYLFALIFVSLGLKGILVSVAKGFFPTWEKPDKYVVFVVAILLAIPFRIWYDTDIAQLIVSFGLGTSAYDLLLEDFIKWGKEYLKKKFEA